MNMYMYIHIHIDKYINSKKKKTIHSMMITIVDKSYNQSILICIYI